MRSGIGAVPLTVPPPYPTRQGRLPMGFDKWHRAATCHLSHVRPGIGARAGLCLFIRRSSVLAVHLYCRRHLAPYSRLAAPSTTVHAAIAAVNGLRSVIDGATRTVA